MSLYDELMAGTTVFSVEDETEKVHRKPPTSLAMRAANRIKELEAAFNQLNQHAHRLQQDHINVVDQFNQLSERYKNDISILQNRGPASSVASGHGVSGTGDQHGQGQPDSEAPGSSPSTDPQSAG